MLEGDVVEADVLEDAVVEVDVVEEVVRAAKFQPFTGMPLT